MDDDIFGPIFPDLNHIHAEHAALDQEFLKLLDDRSARRPKVGDRVIVAAGLIGRGHRWVRNEAIVLELGESSYKVQFAEAQWSGEPDIVWIHSALVTDVLPEKDEDEIE